MKKKLLAFAILCISIAMHSCNQERCGTKQQFLDEFELFISDAKKAIDTDTEEERLAREDAFKDLINVCYKKHRENLSLEERQDFWKASVIYYMEKGGVLSLDLKIGSENDEEFNNYIQNELEAVIKDSGEDFERIIQEIIQKQLMPSLKDLFKGIEDLGKNLQDAIDN